MDSKGKFAIVVAGVAIVSYSIGYSRATTRMIREYSVTSSEEMMNYLAAKDIVKKFLGDNN